MPSLLNELKRKLNQHVQLKLLFKIRDEFRSLIEAIFWHFGNISVHLTKRFRLKFDPQEYSGKGALLRARSRQHKHERPKKQPYLLQINRTMDKRNIYAILVSFCVIWLKKKAKKPSSCSLEKNSVNHWNQFCKLLAQCIIRLFGFSSQSEN